MLIRESPYDIVLSILILVIFSFNALISYSKGGIILMAIGWLSWLFYILLQISLTKKTKLVAIFLLMMIVLFVRDDGRLLQYRDSITTLLNFKFGNIKPEDNNAIRERLGYFTATKEIFFTSPLLGVGYSGFYDAVTRTKAYAKGLTPKEDANANSHPHNTFLYYIAVNGILGALLSVFFFFFMISLIIRHMRDYNTFGKIFGSLLILSLFLVGSTTIWLFNGPIPILIFTILLHHQLIKKGMLPKNNYS
jgi:O-antigen ligase